MAGGGVGGVHIRCWTAVSCPGTGFQLLIAIEPLSLVQETLQKKWAGILHGLHGLKLLWGEGQRRANRLLWANRPRDGRLLAELVASFGI